MKVKHIIPALLLIMLFTSCDDDFLTLPSQSSLSTPVYFKTEADFKAAVNGIYGEMRSFFNFTTGTGGVPATTGGVTTTAAHILIGDMHSDNARYYFNPNYRATTAAENAADFVPENQLFSGNWNSFYVWISRANQILDLIDAADVEQSAKDNLKGQALFLRAYGYWWLARLYGNACLHLKPVTSVEEASLPLSSESDIIAQVIEDATSAASLLKDKANQEAGRVTSGTSKMLLAEVYMWQKRWSDAEALLLDIKNDYLLMTDYADVFDPTKKNNAESIFEIQYSSASLDYSNGVIYSMFPHPFTADTLKSMTGISNPQALSEGEGMCIPNPDLIALYEPGDARFAASIDSVYDANGVRLPMCIKYLHPHSSYRQGNDNMPVYRYAEALLFLAEAVNEQGGRSDIALGYLNEVRDRAKLDDSPAVTQEEIRDAIMKERQVELAFEGKRWFDLVRTDKVTEVIGAYGAKVKANPMQYYFTVGQSPVPSAFTNITTRFNLPDAEVLYNPYID